MRHSSDLRAVSSHSYIIHCSSLPQLINVFQLLARQLAEILIRFVSADTYNALWNPAKSFAFKLSPEELAAHVKGALHKPTASSNNLSQSTTNLAKTKRHTSGTFNKYVNVLVLVWLLELWI